MWQRPDLRNSKINCQVFTVAGPRKAVQFTFYPNDLRAEVINAVGHVILEWAMLEWEVNQIHSSMYHIRDSTYRVARDFNSRTEDLVRLACLLYRVDLDIADKLKSFIQDVKAQKGKRDEIAHGIPGTFMNKFGKEKPGIVISREPHSKDLYRIVRVSTINATAQKISTLKNEGSHWSSEISRAIAAASSSTVRLPNGKKISAAEYYWPPQPPR